MKCFECDRSVYDGHALFRQNEKGVKGIWACRDHNEKDIDEEVDDIVKIIENKE